MARVCLLGHPAAGHINPTLPVVAELVRRGERVVYFATPPFQERIERTGAAFRSYGAQALFERNLGAGGLLGGMAGLMETTAQLLPELAQQVRAEAPDYLLIEAHAVWGNLLAQGLGRPAVTLCSMFAINERLLSARALLDHLYGQAPPAAVLEGLLGLQRYFSLCRDVDRRFATRSPGILDYLGNRQPLNLVFTARELQVGADAFGPDYVFVGAQLGARAGEEDPALRGDPDLPLVYVSMGTMFNDEAPLYRACVEAFSAPLAGRPRRVLMAVGHRLDRAQWPAAPDHVEIRAEVPQLAVLRRASLFVTHGGINSAHEGMLAGVPMLVLPSTADHHVVAAQVERVGAGLVLERSRASAAELRAHADRLLADPTFARRSRAMGDCLRAAGGPARAADAILTHVNRAPREV